MVGIGSIVGVGHLLGVKSSLIASLAPKSVTTPIAMELAGNNGGIPGLTAVIVVCAGIIGSIIGPPIMKLMKIKSPVAKGLAMGASPFQRDGERGSDRVHLKAVPCSRSDSKRSSAQHLPSQ